MAKAPAKKEEKAAEAEEAALDYVAIEPDPADGRAKLVKLTARGRSLTSSLLEESAAAERALRTALGAKRVSALRETLLDAAEYLSPPS